VREVRPCICGGSHMYSVSGRGRQARQAVSLRMSALTFLELPRRLRRLLLTEPPSRPRLHPLGSGGRRCCLPSRAPSSNQTIVEGFTPAIVATHVVRLSLSLPLSMVEFNHRQAKFIQSIARAAGASPAHVEAIFSSARDFPVNYSGINNTTRRKKYTSINRRLLASSIRIDVSVMAKDKAAADVMVARRTYHNINAELAKAGFPRAEVVVNSFTQSLSATPFPIAPIIGRKKR